jgi:hypothetical protein
MNGKRLSPANNRSCINYSNALSGKKYVKEEK